MAFLTESELRNRSSIAKSRLSKSASQILNESFMSFSSLKLYDVFLSHCIMDAELILGLKEYLESEFSLSVYVDWIEDKQLDRNSVNRETADLLRKRMRTCRSLIYAVSDNSNKSRWMPWELGYFDGHKNGKVAIMPITQKANDQFRGEEYLQLYNYIEKTATTSLYGKDKLKIGNVEVKSWIG